MKRFFKITGKILLTFFGLLFLAYWIFRINEYVVGNDYVGYLKKNQLTKSSLNENLKLDFDNEYYNNQLFMLGEIHEISTSPTLDVETFKDLHEKQDVKIYLAEMDIAQAYYLNRYLQDSIQISLDKVLKNWSVWIGQHSKEYREQKWAKLKRFYKGLDRSEQFVVYGLDKVVDFDLLHLLLKEKLPTSFSQSIPVDEDGIRNWINKNLAGIIETKEFSTKDSILLRNIEYNIKNPDSLRYRDEFMFQNFKRYFNENHWETMKMYGCFGLFHTLQGSERSLAGKIRNSELLKDKFVSIASAYTDSYLTVPSDALPALLVDEGKYSKLKFSNDNIFLSYIKGIEDFKRASNENSINLFKLNGKDSPYKTSGRGLKNFSLIPLWGNIPIDKNKKTIEYIQYVYFIDGADWMSPE